MTIEAKSNETPAFALLLDAVQAVHGDLTGVGFVADAMHTQTRHAAELTAPRRPPARPGKGQPADPAQPAQATALGTGPGRAPHRNRGRRETRTVKVIILQTPAASASRRPNWPSG